MKYDATEQHVTAVTKRIESSGARVHLSEGEERTIIGVLGDSRALDRDQIARVAGVERIVPILHPYKLASREMKPETTTMPLNGVQVGDKQVVLIAGPCSVEGRQQILETAHAVKEAGATALRGGAFKPRSSPYSFQGLGLEGLEMLAEAREQTGLPIVTEVMAPEQVSMVCKYADVLQIGARNMQNYSLLLAIGQTTHPVLLKRGMMSTMEELLMSAEYILSCGNQNVMLCERGIRTFETYTRNTFDVNAIPALKAHTHLPVIADPSHATGHWEYVGAAARAAVAAGADGLLIEVHPEPVSAFSDGAQSLKPNRFAELVPQLRLIAEAVERTL
jgi:3-deoxy-7-phosphoheptulonate synthase